MDTAILASILLLVAVCVCLQLYLVRLGRAARTVNANAEIREEFRAVRDESSQRARELREEVASSIEKMNGQLTTAFGASRQDQRAALELVSTAVREGARATSGVVDRLATRVSEAQESSRNALETKFEALRSTTDERLGGAVTAQRESASALETAVRDLLEATRREMGAQREAIERQLTAHQEASQRSTEVVRALVENKLADAGEQQGRRSAEVVDAVRDLTTVSRTTLDKQGEAVLAQLDRLQQSTRETLEQVRASVEEKLRLGQEDQRNQYTTFVGALQELGRQLQEASEKSRQSVDQKLQSIQEGNERKLEEMRLTVDEKLHQTLERRLGESFKLVSDRLEAVQKGLGEMQGLASGVGDLKRVLTNVKDRGTWGEYQLEAILEQVLTPDQYGRNVATTNSGERVEFAVRMPGEGRDLSKPVWLPIDAKFPKEDYERLVAASQAGDVAGADEATKRLLGSLTKAAKDIHEKYVGPPLTTDFAILFLPTEGLYAEALRQPGFQDEIQRKYRVLIAGPATTAAILTSLRVGFQTLAIEQRADEIWDLLRAVKTEFVKFGDHLAKVKRQLNAASNTIEQTETRTRAMARKLRDVEILPGAPPAPQVFGLPEDSQGDPGDADALGVDDGTD